MSAIFKDTFWLFLAASATAHAVLWFVIPNPLKQATKPQQIEVLSTIPVVTLPAQPQLKAQLNSIDKKSNLTTLKSQQITQPVEKTLVDRKPVKDDSNKLDRTSKPQAKPIAKPIVKAPNKNTEKKSDEAKNQNPQKSESIDRSNDSKLAESPEPDPNIAQTSPKDNPKPDDPISSKGSSDVANIFKQYSGNISLRRIAPPSAIISASQIEPDIEWISPKLDGIGNAKGTVSVALLVTPEGKVDRQLIERSGVEQLDKIASQTVEGYYDKFKPSKDGKYRYVIIEFKFPIAS